MNKTELVEQAAERAGISKDDTAKALDGLVDTLSVALQSGEKITIQGFGTFETRDRAARQGRNPQTGDPVDIPASTTAAFKPASALKSSLNSGGNGS